MTEITYMCVVIFSAVYIRMMRVININTIFSPYTGISLFPQPSFPLLFFPSGKNLSTLTEFFFSLYMIKKSLKLERLGCRSTVRPEFRSKEFRERTDRLEGVIRFARLRPADSTHVIDVPSTRLK